MAIRKPTEWTLDEARRHLHALIGEAVNAGPQPVERGDTEAALIVPIESWVNVGSLADFFLNSPLRGSDIDLERLPDTVADFDDWMRRRGTVEDLEHLADSLLARDEETH